MAVCKDLAHCSHSALGFTFVRATSHCGASTATRSKPHPEHKPNCGIPGFAPRVHDSTSLRGYYDESFQQVDGASYQEILDVSNWDYSVAIDAPGQSGQPGSRHYSDLLPLWSEGKYFPLAYSRDAVERRDDRQAGVKAVMP